jgi:hypothetical protein
MRWCLSVAVVVLLLALEVAAAPRELWLYYSTNLQVRDNVPKAQAIWRRAATAGYTHILLTDSKMAKLGDLGEMTDVYFGNLAKLKALAAELKLELVPAVFHIGYSNNMLWHDPNLAEGLPVKDAKFVVRRGEARVVADPPVVLKPRPDWKDDLIALAPDGVASITAEFRDNARLVWKLNVTPFRCYHVSVKVRTRDFTGEPRITVLGGKGGPSLQQENLGAKPTQDWTERHVIFNSLENSQVNIYFGVWGGGRGELAWKEFRIEEAGLTNILRRSGTPLIVKTAAGRMLEEGKDFEPVVDAKVGRRQWAGDYDSWHVPPAIRTRGLADGTELRVSWYHPAIIYDGQVSCCPSEPRTMELLADEARRVKAAFAARGYMMCHDEVRTLNWDEACMKRNLSAGQILAHNVRECTKLLAGSRVYVWSDMFDPHHNAVDNYYLVRGSLKGSWEGLDKSVTIMNWNFGKRDASLKFFADRGHHQIIAGYYDHDPKQVREWLESARRVQGVIGVMYTTWQQKYGDLEEFARLISEAR